MNLFKADLVWIKFLKPHITLIEFISEYYFREKGNTTLKCSVPKKEAASTIFMLSFVWQGLNPGPLAAESDTGQLSYQGDSCNLRDFFRNSKYNVN